MNIRWTSGLSLFAAFWMTQLPVRAAEDAFHNNVNCVDLSDLRGRLPLKASETKKILRKSERWESSTWKWGARSHYSSPCVVWNEDEQLWFVYFHYYNHFHGAWEADPQYSGEGNQMTALASCADVASHEWTIVKDVKLGEVSVHDIVPVLQISRRTLFGRSSSAEMSL
jgi:hypothetical protein